MANQSNQSIKKIYFHCQNVQFSSIQHKLNDSVYTLHVNVHTNIYTQTRKYITTLPFNFKSYCVFGILMSYKLYDFVKKV